MYYVVEHHWTLGGDEGILKATVENRIHVQTEPALGNRSGEPVIHGWAGTTDNWAVYAHGEYTTKAGAIAAARALATACYYRAVEVDHLEDEHSCRGVVVEAFRDGAVPTDAGDWLAGIRDEVIGGAHDAYRLSDDTLGDLITADAAHDGILLIGLDAWLAEAREETAEAAAEAVSVLPRDDVPGETLEVVVRMNGGAYACLVAPMASGQGYEPCGDCVERWLEPREGLSREQVKEIADEATLAADVWARAEGLL